MMVMNDLPYKPVIFLNKMDIHDRKDHELKETIF